MPKWTFPLSLAALALAAYAALVATASQRDATRAQADLHRALDARIVALESVLAGRPEARAPALAAAPETGPARGGAETGATARGGTATAATDVLNPTPASLPELALRLEALEKALVGTIAPPAPASVAFPSETIEATPWIGSVDDAATTFGLTPAQKAEAERIVSDARRESDALRAVPDDTGRTWDLVEKESVEFRDGHLTFDGTKVQEFREKVIPGRTESFGAAQRRIRTEAKRRLREGLTTDQQAKFDKAHVDGLLPGGGGGPFGDFSFVTVTSPAVEPLVPPPDPK